MTAVIENLLEKYKALTRTEFKNAIHEIMQEIALLGLWRAKFFDQAAFYGGTALRILYGLNRFSEDLDFSLLQPNPSFDFIPFLKAIEEEMELSGLNVAVEHKIKHPEESIRSAFLKTGTLETFIRIGLDESLRKHTQSNELIKIKLEIDIDPPSGFLTESVPVIQPIPFSVRSYTTQDLFAGKMHALLCRAYKVRVKGRDWYDFIWYVSKGHRLHLAHLETRMRQSGHWTSPETLSPKLFSELMRQKIAGLNLSAAKEDIQRFIRDPRDVEGWSADFFLSLLPKIQFTS
jgi:predicted nucleotidyltransferase component of viral defense system